MEKNAAPLGPFRCLTETTLAPTQEVSLSIMAAVLPKKKILMTAKDLGAIQIQAVLDGALAPESSPFSAKDLWSGADNNTPLVIYAVRRPG